MNCPNCARNGVTERKMTKRAREGLELCPKGYAWCIADCDQGQECDKCDIDSYLHPR